MTERDQERGDGRDPIDEEAAWAEIVAGYGDEPVDPPGVWPRADQLDLTDTVDRADRADRADRTDGADAADAADAADRVTAPGRQAEDGAADQAGEPTESGAGPRDWEAAEDPEDDHFVPPDPPPLPETDLSTKLAWVAVLGGPLLLIIAVLLQRQMTWWLVTLGVGGFLGGFAALVTRMRDGRDDDWTDPGSGAVV